MKRAETGWRRYKEKETRCFCCKATQGKDFLNSNETDKHTVLLYFAHSMSVWGEVID